MGSIPFHEHLDDTGWSGPRPFVDLVPYAVVLAEPDGAASWVNRAWTQLTGQTEPAWRGHGWLDVCRGPDREVRWSALAAAARDGASHETDWAITANGRGPRTLRVHAVPDTEGDRLVRIVITAADVTEDRARSARLLDQASHDSLTGLLNRAQFLEFLQHALERRRRASGGIVAVLFVDVDDLKATNDLFGHDAGDRLLRGVAARIKAALRPADIVARFGGDEFTILCEDLDGDAEADAIADRIRSSVRSDGRCDVSIGVALAEDADINASGMVKEADQAMYEAKTVRGRGHVDGRRTASRAVRVRPQPPVPSADHALSARLTTIAGLATMLRANLGHMEAGDVDSALTSIERHARGLDLLLDQLTDPCRRRHWPPLVGDGPSGAV